MKLITTYKHLFDLINQSNIETSFKKHIHESYSFIYKCLYTSQKQYFATNLRSILFLWSYFRFYLLNNISAEQQRNRRITEEHKKLFVKEALGAYSNVIQIGCMRLSKQTSLSVAVMAGKCLDNYCSFHLSAHSNNNLDTKLLLPFQRYFQDFLNLPAYTTCCISLPNMWLVRFNGSYAVKVHYNQSVELGVNNYQLND